MEFTYQPKTEKQLLNSYIARERKGLNGFENFLDFLNWYNSQEKKCHYCNLTEIESQQLVKTGILTSNRFPQNEIAGRGTSRGMWLEVDRKLPKGKYSGANCKLSCYFCNNDKSDVFTEEEYFRFKENRVGFLREKLKQ